MKKTFSSLLSSLLLTAAPLFAQFPCPVSEWSRLEKSVRDGTLLKPVAQSGLKKLFPGLGQYAHQKIPRTNTKNWAFPSAGGKKRYNIGGKDGSGFHPAWPGPVYDFYEGNKHGGHPAHDIFINDRNNDCLDDQTNRPVNALSLLEAVVISLNEEWQPENPRGGKYLWLYQPQEELFFYYAHLDKIFVRPGEVVKKGQPLGTIGKTGFPKGREHRPCHIHLMVLKYDRGRMTPFDFYPFLK